MTENFSLKVLKISVLICGFLLYLRNLVSKSTGKTIIWVCQKIFDSKSKLFLSAENCVLRLNSRRNFVVHFTDGLASSLSLGIAKLR